MKKWTCEIVKDFDGTYYANMYVNGKRIDLPEYVDYRTLKNAIKEKTGIEILKHKDMIFENLPCSRKKSALLDATCERPDIRVTMAERIEKIAREKGLR
jgi:hypothetical protein